MLTATGVACYPHFAQKLHWRQLTSHRSHYIFAASTAKTVFRLVPPDYLRQAGAEKHFVAMELAMGTVSVVHLELPHDYLSWYARSGCHYACRQA
jgi:hypothetical protein